MGGLLGGLFYYFSFKVEEKVVEVPEVCIDIDEPILIHGFNVDTMDVSLGTVQNNQNLSGLLDGYGIGYQTIYKLAKNSRKVYDVRKLRAGDDYTIIHTRGEKKKATKFIIEPSSREYVIYHLDDSIYTERVARKIELRERSVAGEIQSSVYMAAVNNGGSPQLVNRLVDVFAWQIDFFTVQKGDKF